MKILKIQRNKLFLENQIIDINKDIIYEFSLKKDMEIDEQLYTKIIYKAGLSKAYYMLSLRDYPAKILENKLILKLKNPYIIKKIMDKLKNDGYINDIDYAKRFIETKKYGKKRIYYELYLKGIDRSVIDKAYCLDENNEKEKLLKQLEKIKNKDREKKIAYLLRRGFSLSDILDIINEM